MKKVIFSVIFISAFFSIKAQDTIIFRFDSISEYSEGLAAVLYEGRWGYADNDKQLVIPNEFETANSFHNDTALAKVMNHWFYIVRNGNEFTLINKENNQLILTIPKPEKAIQFYKPYIAKRNADALAFTFAEKISPDENKIMEVLKRKNDSLVVKGYNKEIAGLLAAIIVFKQKNSFNGQLAQLTFDKYNTSFEKVCPNIYSKIGNLKLTSDKLGTVKITTTDGEDVKIADLKIKNNASFTLTETEGKYYLKNIKGIVAYFFDVIEMELHPLTGKVRAQTSVKTKDFTMKDILR